MLTLFIDAYMRRYGGGGGGGGGGGLTSVSIYKADVCVNSNAHPVYLSATCNLLFLNIASD